MKRHLKRWYRVIAAVSVMVGPMPGSIPQLSAQSATPGVIPPNATAYGMTYGQWSARWWQWAFSLPVNESPFFDEGGNCSRGANAQLGPVWFLAGVINVSGTAVRNCSVPAGKALFFPIINVECSTLELPPFHGGNAAELRTCATSSPFSFGGVFADIDGVAVQSLDRYLKASPLFTFTVPPDNVLGVSAGTGQSVSNGFYLMLAPLPVGEHVVHFGGTFTDFNFTLDITYNLTVSQSRS